ncbi:transglycosylase domain-containing protein [Streptomyces sp. NPDC002537]
MDRADVGRAQQRDRKPKKPKKKGIRRFFTWKMLLAYFLGVVLLGVGAFVVLYFSVAVPGEGNAAAKLQSNLYKLSDGRTVARVGEMNREDVPLSKISKDVQHAVVAAENKTFYTDSGVDPQGIARAFFSTLMGHGKQGGSTITQQFVKNYYLDQQQSVSRKLKELIISLKVQDKFSKDQILQGYLNTSFYGRGAYGIQAAARAYYNKDADKLNVQESAYLAALLQAPSQYDWAVATEDGKKNVQARWGYVLDKMVEQNWLSSEDRAKMQFEKPTDPKPAAGLKGENGYLVEMAKQEVIRDLVKEGRSEKDAEQEFAAGGWTVTLSIDSKKQKALEDAVKNKLLDNLDPRSRAVDGHVQTGAVSVDRKTGRIVALYGGPDYLKHYTNNATRRDYQPASTFKPIILAAALENGSKTQGGQRITPSTSYDGTNKRPVVGPHGGGYAPENEDGFSQNPISVQDAMDKSVNAVFAQMVVDVGLSDVKKTAEGLGMKGNDTGFYLSPAMALGSMGASPLDMAGVYATLDNHGKKVTPSILKSVSRSGKEFKLPDPIGKDHIVGRSAADGVTSVLRDVVNQGTASHVRSSRYDVAAKTGTSDDNKSAWLTGYTPDLITSVGLFGEAPGGTQVTLKNAGGKGRVNGGAYPADIWAAYTEKALGSDATAKFDLETGGYADPGPPAGSPPPSSPSAQASPSDSPPPSTHSSPPPDGTVTGGAGGAAAGGTAAGGTSAGVSGGANGGAAGGAAGGSSGGAAGGANGGAAGGTSGGSSGGAAGGTAGGSTGGAAGGSSGASTGGDANGGANSGGPRPKP